MEFKRRTLTQLADMICGNYEEQKTLFRYRTSSRLTEFFSDCDTDYIHDGSTRSSWVYAALYDILQEPHPDARTPPDTFCRVIRVLMDKDDGTPSDDANRTKALEQLNGAVCPDAWETHRVLPDRQLPDARPVPVYDPLGGHPRHRQADRLEVVGVPSRGHQAHQH